MTCYAGLPEACYQDIEIPPVAGLERFDPASIKALVKCVDLKNCGGPWISFPSGKADLNWHIPTCDEHTWKHKDVELVLGQGIAYVTLNRPDQQNCINDSIMDGLCDAVYVLHRRTDIRVTCFMAKGPVFCGGEDPERLANLKGGKRKAAPKQIQPYVEKFTEEAKKIMPGFKADWPMIKETMMWMAITQIPSVTVGVVTGSVVGSGIGLLACLDMSISLKSALFSLPDLKGGLFPALVLPLIVQKVGAPVAKRLLCAGEIMDAETAKGADLVQEVLDDEKGLTDWIWEISDSVTQCGPESVKAAKDLVLGVGGMPISEPVMFYTGSMLAMVTVSEEARVGMIALQQKTLKPWEEKPITPLYGENPHPERRQK